MTVSGSDDEEEGEYVEITCPHCIIMAILDRPDFDTPKAIGVLLEAMGDILVHDVKDKNALPEIIDIIRQAFDEDMKKVVDGTWKTDQDPAHVALLHKGDRPN